MKNLLLKGLLTTAILSSYGMASTIKDEARDAVFDEVNKNKISNHHSIDEQQELDDESKQEKPLLKGKREKCGSVLSTIEGMYEFCKKDIPKHTEHLNSLIDQYTGMFSKKLQDTSVKIDDEDVNLYTIFQNSDTLITNFLTIAGLNQSTIRSLKGESVDVLKEAMKIIKFVFNLKGEANPSDENSVSGPTKDVKLTKDYSDVVENFRNTNSSTLQTSDSTTSGVKPPVGGITVATPIGTVSEPFPDTPLDPSSRTNASAVTSPATPLVSTLSSMLNSTSTTSSNTVKSPVVTPDVWEDSTTIKKAQAYFSAFLRYINETAKSINEDERKLAQKIQKQIIKTLKSFLRSMQNKLQ